MIPWSSSARADPLAPPRGPALPPEVLEPTPDVVESVAVPAPPPVDRPRAEASGGALLWLAVVVALGALLARRGLARDLAGRWGAFRAGLRPGCWVEIEGAPQRVVRLGWTSVWTGGGDSLRRTPLRRFSGRPLVVDQGRWPAVTVLVVAPPGGAPDRVAERLRRAVEIAAVVAPGGLGGIAPDPVTPRLWRVTVRLLEPGLRDAFGAVLLSHLSTLDSPDP